MVPVPLFHNRYRTPSAAISATPRLLYISLSLVTKYALRFLRAEEGAFRYSGTTSYEHLGGEFGGRSGGSFGGLVRRATKLDEGPPWKRILFPLLIPILVLLSGVFAGLTLGYMSLDETQLNVLSISGTPTQREYASKIMPIRKNGHLLLVTLLLANMIVNETLPVIADPVLGGGFPSVVVSTVLIVIFAEIIPQSLFTRHGLYLGAKMAWFATLLIYGLGIISWPVAKLLEFVLGKHHGIIYRRAELKELIAMHDAHNIHGGDLKTDTVTIIGATLDLQEKVVRQAMTPIADVFMVSIDSNLDHDLLKKICQTGHSRVPVYEEVEVPIAAVPLGAGIPSAPSLGPDSRTSAEGGDTSTAAVKKDQNQRMVKVKKIVGVLLVKHCVLLDPRNATSLRKIPLNKVPFVPNNEPLLGMLDKFQEGRSHMAIVSRYSVDKAQSVKKAVKRGLTQRLRASVGIGDTDSSSSSSSSSSDEETDSATSGLTYVKKWAGGKKHSQRRRRFIKKEQDVESGNGNGTPEDGIVVDVDGETLGEDRTPPSRPPAKRTDSSGSSDKAVSGENIEMQTHTQDWGSNKKGRKNKVHRKKKQSGEGSRNGHGNGEGGGDSGKKQKESVGKKTTFQLSPLSMSMSPGGTLLEQSMPADAVLAKEGADEFLQSIDPAVMPLGIITLEDVLEELIGEEIYDEFDPQGAHGDPYAYDVAPLASTNSHPPGPAVSYTADVKHANETNPNVYLDTHGVTVSTNTPKTQVNATATPTAPALGTTHGSGTAVGTPATGRSIPIPLPGIPMLRGFGFLTRRSKSAPPVPRNKPKQNENEGGGDVKEKDHELDDDDLKQELDVAAGVGEEARATSHSNASTNAPVSQGGTTDSQEIKMPRPVRGIPRATIQQLGMTSLSPATAASATSAGGGSRSLSNSRSVSPAPAAPLEAILLERNRRRLARESSGGGSPASGASTGSESGGGEGGKGRAFKSSPLAPLSGGSGGAVVVQRVGRSMDRETRAKEEPKEKGEKEGEHSNRVLPNVDG